MSVRNESNDDTDEVQMNDSKISTKIIKTNDIGPCLALLLNFKYYEQDHSLLSHYSFSIIENESNPLIHLIKMLDYLTAELNQFILISEIINKPEIFSDATLIVAGGDPKEAKYTQEAFCLLNGQEINCIEKICFDKFICLLYNQLINNVTIFKSVSKILNSPESDEDEGQIHN